MDRLRLSRTAERKCQTTYRHAIYTLCEVIVRLMCNVMIHELWSTQAAKILKVQLTPSSGQVTPCHVSGTCGKCIVCVDKKNQLDVTFCILYFSSNSCSTCFGQPCAHHQELTTANRTWQPSRSHGTNEHEAITSRSRQLLMMSTWLPETCWATIRREIKNTKSDI